MTATSGWALAVRRVRQVFEAEGALGVARAIVRRTRLPHAHCFPLAREIVRDAECFEVGGPSAMFARGGLLPLYQHARRVDNCNFATTTIWEGSLAADAPFHFDAARPPGRQYIAEAQHLTGVPSAAYDVVLSSHALEHTANPLGALAACRRILRPGGLLVLVLPSGAHTFDHRRPITTLEHLRADREAVRGEDDTTHLAEELALHDYDRDPGAHTISALVRAERVAQNATFRTVHHHVFDLPLAVAVVEEAGFHVCAQEWVPPYHLVVLATAPK